MEYTDQQRAEFKEQYGRRRKAQWIIAAIIIGAGGLLVMSQAALARGPNDRLALSFLTLFIAIVLVALVFTLRNWRCPACNGYLGRNMGVNFCPKCGVQLRDT